MQLLTELLRAESPEDKVSVLHTEANEVFAFAMFTEFLETHHVWSPEEDVARQHNVIYCPVELFPPRVQQQPT